jgi:hypothetical protein
VKAHPVPGPPVDVPMPEQKRDSSRATRRRRARSLGRPKERLERRRVVEEEEDTTGENGVVDGMARAW